MERIEQLVKFLGRLNAGENPSQLRKEYETLLLPAEPIDFAWAGHTMLESGMATYDFCGLCEKIKALLGDQVAILLGKLAAGHPMQQIFSQHKRYLQILNDIENLNTALATLHPAWAGCPEYQRLKNLADDIAWIERHTLAEQNVLLPEIDQRNSRELTQIIRFQHLDLSHSYKRIKILAGNLNNLDFNSIRRQFDSITQWLVPVGRMHITVEEHVFYPIAGSFIEGKETWDKFLAICNPPKHATTI
jgi:DUF438 domain-containing protein